MFASTAFRSALMIITFTLNILCTYITTHLQSASLPLLVRMAIACILHAYIWSIIASTLSPHGIDVHAFQSYSLISSQKKSYSHHGHSVGRGRFSPIRVAAMMRTSLHSATHSLLLATRYLAIRAFWTHCRRHCVDSDLSNISAKDMPRCIARIVSAANQKCIEVLRHQERHRRHFLAQSTYRQRVEGSATPAVQCHVSEMISLLNIHFDADDATRTAHAFVAPYEADAHVRSRGVVFLIGGAWGTCDETFAACVGASFVQHACSLLFVKYKVFPDGDVNDMIGNVEAAVQWVVRYADVLRVDSDNIVIVGQSSGAHLGALTILRAFQKQLCTMTGCAFLKNVI